jgi:hypothetical protein
LGQKFILQIEVPFIRRGVRKLGVSEKALKLELDPVWVAMLMLTQRGDQPNGVGAYGWARVEK